MLEWSEAVFFGLQGQNTTETRLTLRDHETTQGDELRHPICWERLFTY